MPGKVAGPICTERNAWWAVAIDQGTMCQQRSSQVGPICAERSSVSIRCRIATANEQQGSYNELLIISGTEWLKFIANLGANATGPIKDTIKDALPALKKLGPVGRAAVREQDGKEYVIISGYAGLRKILTGTRYLAENPKVADLVIGTSRLAESAIKGVKLSIVLVAADDVLEAFLDDKVLLSQDLAFTVLADVGKAAIATLAGFIASAVVATSGIVFLPIAAGIVVGIVVTMALDKYVPTENLVKAIDDAIDRMLDEAGRTLHDFERALLRTAWPFDQPLPPGF